MLKVRTDVTKVSCQSADNIFDFLILSAIGKFVKFVAKIAMGFRVLFIDV